MKKLMIFISGLLVGSLIWFALYNKGMGNNSGSEFWGDEYLDFMKDTGKGMGNNSGSKFYSDLYIKERYRSTNLTNGGT